MKVEMKNYYNVYELLSSYKMTSLKASNHEKKIAYGMTTFSRTWHDHTDKF